ncbi:hypothetical protein ACJ6WF_06195 [Streptomyces sp. MMS24-I2-30]|uniref:hypothetical protein n=1 Tax=Streptomyces sp. MMS24-I2-30 TaxID=3351564 RepID=UPI00389686EF
MYATDTRPVLVVGSTTTRIDLEDLTAAAFDVADHLCLPVVVATGRDYRPEDYEGVVLVDGWECSFSSAALGAEALLADVCTLWQRDVDEYPLTTTCAHCFERADDVRPRPAADGWTAPVCSGCVAVHASLMTPGILSVAALEVAA